MSRAASVRGIVHGMLLIYCTRIHDEPCENMVQLDCHVRESKIFCAICEIMYKRHAVTVLVSAR